MIRVHDKTEDEMRVVLTAYAVPEHLHEGLLRYLFGGYLTGSFLFNVLANDLREAVMRADEVSILALKPLVGFINMEIPSNAHGSEAIVKAYAEAQRARNTVSTPAPTAPAP